MIKYYLSLSLRGFRRHPWFVVLIAMMLGAGTGLFTTTYSLLFVLAGDPIPEKSDRLLSISIGQTTEDGEPIAMMPMGLVSMLRKALPDVPVVATAYGFGAIKSEDVGKRRSEVVRFADAGFFSLFNVPILDGRGWTSEEGANGAQVVVIGRSFAESMFGTTAVVGRSIYIGNAYFRITGVLDDWRPMPRYYDLSIGAYAPADQIFLPLSSMRVMDDEFFVARMCPMEQADVVPRVLEGSSCSWLSTWALVSSPGQRAFVRSRVEALLHQWQRREGWLESRSGARIENVQELLRRTGVVPGGVKFGVLLALGFLLLCLVNAAGLLLAKCLRRSQEIGVRRSLGASRMDIIQQFMVEAGLLGLAGSVAGVAFAALGIKLMQQLPEYYMQLAKFSWPMLLLALGISVIAGLAAGLFPAWRASLIDPAIQVKVD